MTSLPHPDRSPNVTADDLARLRAELLEQLHTIAPRATKPIPLEEFRNEVLALYEPPMRSRATGNRMRYLLRIVVELAGPGATTADLTSGLMCKLVASRPATESAHTTNSLLRLFRVVCNLAIGSGYLQVSPFALRKPFLRVRPAARQKHHSLAVIKRALEIAREDITRKVPGSPSQWRARRTYIMFALAAYTGMRRNEVLQLRREDVDIPGRVINIVSRDGNRLKTERSAQPIPMVDALAAALHEWFPHLAIPRGWPARAADGKNPEWNPTGERDEGWVIPNIYRTGPWTGGPPGWKPLDRLKKLGRRAGAEGLTFLSLRHSWATHAESAWGLSALQIQRVLRHTSAKTQELYRHADLPNLRAALGSVGFGTEPQPGAPPAPAEPPPVPPAPPAVAEPLKPINPKNPSKPGVRHAPKLDEEDVAEARELRTRGWSYCKLRARYGVSKSTLNAMLNGITHRHVPMPPAEGS